MKPEITIYEESPARWYFPFVKANLPAHDNYYD